MLPLAAHAETKDSLPGMEVQPAGYFYTGKPYDSDTGSYTFKYRNYDPELNRWTTMDPSGFRDGANNSAYNATPTYEYDWQGLETSNISHTFQAYSGVGTTVDAKIQGSWTAQPSLADVRFGFGTTIGGSKSFSSGSNSSTVSWTCSQPNLIISNITDDGQPNVKTYSMDVEYVVSLALTTSSTFDISFEIYGLNVTLIGTGESTTTNYNFSYSGSAQLSVAE